MVIILSCYPSAFTFQRRVRACSSEARQDISPLKLVAARVAGGERRKGFITGRSAAVRESEASKRPGLGGRRGASLLPQPAGVPVSSSFAARFMLGQVGITSYQGTQR